MWISGKKMRSFLLTLFLRNSVMLVSLESQSLLVRCLENSVHILFTFTITHLPAHLFMYCSHVHFFLQNIVVFTELIDKLKRMA